MFSPTTSPVDVTLNKMANLEELSNFVVSTNVAMEAKRGNMVKLLVDMQRQVVKVRDQIESIKNRGNNATADIKKMIKTADTKQEESLKRIKSSITSMLEMDQLESAVKNLEGDITSLSGVATDSLTLDPTAPEFVPAASRGTTDGPTLGGYTYGKSRKKGKGRRKRTKKSRKKGSYKSKY
jgi:hypothetical protein